MRCKNMHNYFISQQIYIPTLSHTLTYINSFIALSCFRSLCAKEQKGACTHTNIEWENPINPFIRYLPDKYQVLMQCLKQSLIIVCQL